MALYHLSLDLPSIFGKKKALPNWLVGDDDLRPVFCLLRNCLQLPCNNVDCLIVSTLLIRFPTAEDNTQTSSQSSLSLVGNKLTQQVSQLLQ
jgi:hypothetical protein